ncbi:MAG: ABC transporter substrate-binding protein [bacterium]
MKKKYIIFVFILLFFCGFSEASYDVLAIQSFDGVEPYEHALEGFKNTCNCNVRKIVASELNESAILRRINRSKPDAILAIGMDALSKVKKIKDIPIIYIMIVNPNSILSGEENVTGINMNIPPGKQLEIFKKALPDIKKIGVIFDPNKLGFFVKKAQNEASKMDFKLIVREVNSSKKVPSSLISMKEEIDAIWMLPDITVFSPETIEFLFIFAFENKIPVFTFSKRFFKMGALMSLSTDPFDSGKQGGELANEVVSRKKIRNLSGVEARKIIISINSKMPKKLGIVISDEILNKAEIIH